MQFKVISGSRLVLLIYLNSILKDARVLRKLKPFKLIRNSHLRTFNHVALSVICISKKCCNLACDSLRNPWIGDLLGTLGDAGMGSDIDAAKR